MATEAKETVNGVVTKMVIDGVSVRRDLEGDDNLVVIGQGDFSSLYLTLEEVNNLVFMLKQMKIIE